MICPHLLIIQVLIAAPAIEARRIDSALIQCKDFDENSYQGRVIKNVTTISANMEKSEFFENVAPGQLIIT
jgi:hypothetical protein